MAASYEEFEDYTSCCLDLTEQIIHHVTNEFVGATPDRQYELIDTCHQVLQYLVLAEALFPATSIQDLVEDIKMLIVSMFAFVEENVRITRRERPRIDIKAGIPCRVDLESKI